MPGYHTHPVSRLMALVEPVDDPRACWVWQGTISCNGYGGFSLWGQRLTAHRAAYLLFTGEIPDGMDVCHSCDNRRCINPDHLWLGTRADNMADCKAKGRIATGEKLKTPRGEKSNFAKLTWKDVRAIRASDATTSELALRYGVSADNIRRILRRNTWKEAA